MAEEVRVSHQVTLVTFVTSGHIGNIWSHCHSGHIWSQVRVSQDSTASDKDSGVGEQDMDGACSGSKANSDDKAAADKVGGSD